MNPERNPTEGRIPVKISDGIRYVKPEKIILITANDKQTVVYIKNEVPIQSQTSFKCFKERLLPEFFLSHCSYIVNLNYLVKVDKDWSLLLLEDGHVATLSRNNIGEFKKRTG